MKHVQLGKAGPSVSTLGLGCMGMSGMYGPSDRADGIATIHAAIDAGINLLDTGDFYGMGHNEMLIGEALKGVSRDKVIISVKTGALRDVAGGFNGVDNRPAALKNFVTYSLQRLGVDHVDIYRPARLDPNVPIEETVGAIADMIKAGYVRHIGLSEVGAETIRRAAAVHTIVDLQIEYSLISRGIEDKIMPACRDLGIGITAYGVLSRGLISGHWQKGDGQSKGDFRAHSPRFQGENVERNLALGGGTGQRHHSADRSAQGRTAGGSTRIAGRASVRRRSCCDRDRRAAERRCGRALSGNHARAFGQREIGSVDPANPAPYLGSGLAA
jgi:aryl-alcohol dehydrogenase-like predicted oxidoreductase